MAPPRQEFCKRGHRIADHEYIFPNGRRSCRLCRYEWKLERNKRAAALRPPKIPKVSAEVLPELHGVDRRKLAAIRTWATRRSRYGSAGMSAEALARIRENGRRCIRFATRVKQRLSPTCRRGHSLSGSNLRIYGFVQRIKGRVYVSRKRHCLACEKLRSSNFRPEVVALHDKYYLSTYRRLREQMIAAHPDKGGTSRRFDRARKALKSFEMKEQTWYTQHSMKPPSIKHRKAEAA